jgi:hypothetical protein
MARKSTSSPDLPLPVEDLLPVNFDRIPPVITQVPRWVLWRFHRNADGVLGKIPFEPTGGRADVADPRDLSSLEAVKTAYERDLEGVMPYHGVGFVLGDGFAAVEFERIDDQADGFLRWAVQIINGFATYVEDSADEYGANLIFRHTTDGPNLEPIRHPQGGSLAVWRKNRFICVTGVRWDDPPVPIEDRTSQLRHLIARLDSATPFDLDIHADFQASHAGLKTACGDLSGPDVADRIVQLALAEFRFGRTPAGEQFAVPVAGPQVAQMLRGAADPLRKILAARYRRHWARTPSSLALTDAINIIQAESAEKQPEQVHLRVAAVSCATGGAPGPQGQSNAAPTNEEQEQEAHEASGQTETRSREHSTPNNDRIVIDLGTPDGRAVVVTAQGWQVVDRSPVVFRRTSFTAEHPIPVPGGRLDEFRSLVSVSDEAWQMLRGWLVAALLPWIDHPILIVKGEPLTGKSAALRMLSGLVDPSTVAIRSESNLAENWVSLARDGWCVTLDDVATISPKFGEDLCNAVTGYAFVRNRPNTDGDCSVVGFRRVIAMSGIRPSLLSEDLLAKMLFVELEPFNEAVRLPDTELLARFEALKPQLFGALLDEVSATLRNLPQVQIDRLPRMADFARILAALPYSSPLLSPLSSDASDASSDASIAQNAGQDASDASDAHFASQNICYVADGSRDRKVADASPLEIYLRQIQSLRSEILEDDPVAAGLAQFMQTRQSWIGTATELLSALPRPDSARGWPKLPHILTGRLNRLAPALRPMGITVAYERDTDQLRTRRIQLTATK